MDKLENKDNSSKIIVKQTVKKLFEVGIRLYVAIPSNTKNGSVLIYLRFKNILKTIAKEFRDNDLELQRLEEFLTKGVNITSIYLFGKEGNSDKCPKCTERKVYYLDLEESLRRLLPNIWSHIHLESLNETLYDS
jgi:hypothetical protein